MEIKSFNFEDFINGNFTVYMPNREDTEDFWRFLQDKGIRVGTCSWIPGSSCYYKDRILTGVRGVFGKHSKGEYIWKVRGENREKSVIFNEKFEIKRDNIDQDKIYSGDDVFKFTRLGLFKEQDRLIAIQDGETSIYEYKEIAEGIFDFYDVDFSDCNLEMFDLLSCKFVIYLSKEKMEDRYIPF